MYNCRRFFFLYSFNLGVEQFRRRQFVRVHIQRAPVDVAHDHRVQVQDQRRADDGVAFAERQTAQLRENQIRHRTHRSKTFFAET